MPLQRESAHDTARYELPYEKCHEYMKNITPYPVISRVIYSMYPTISLSIIDNCHHVKSEVADANGIFYFCQPRNHWEKYSYLLGASHFFMNKPRWFAIILAKYCHIRKPHQSTKKSKTVLSYDAWLSTLDNGHVKSELQPNDIRNLATLRPQWSIMLWQLPSSEAETSENKNHRTLACL